MTHHICLFGAQAATERREHETARAESDREEKHRIFGAKQGKHKEKVDAVSIAIKTGQAKLVCFLPLIDRIYTHFTCEPLYHHAEIIAMLARHDSSVLRSDIVFPPPKYTAY